MKAPETGQDNSLIAKKLMNSIRTELPRLILRSHGNAPMKSRESENIQKIEASIAFMVGHLGEPLRVSTLAAQANISPSSYFELFKRHVGSSPMDYFIRLRLQCACHLLENTSLSIKAIAYALGYDDPFYFSRIFKFKSFTRLAPSRYRDSKLKSRDAIRNHGPLPLSSTSCMPKGRGMFWMKRAELMRRNTGASAAFASVMETGAKYARPCEKYWPGDGLKLRLGESFFVWGFYF